MQAIGVPGATEQAEDHIVLVDEGGDVTGQDHETKQCSIAKRAQSDDVHESSGRVSNLAQSRVSRGRNAETAAAMMRSSTRHSSAAPRRVLEVKRPLEVSRLMFRSILTRVDLALKR